MVHSLASRDYGEEVLNSFGCLIVDEAHHWSAPVFSRSLRKMRCEKILALSATPERKDGLTSLLYWNMGEILYRKIRDPEELDVNMIMYNGGQRKEFKMKDGNICLPKMINDMVKDDARNNLLVEIIFKLYHADRNIIILSDRIQQLHSLRDGLLAHEIPANDIAYYIGATPASEREKAEKRRVILSTYSMAKEGLDIPPLDALVMATPKGEVEQVVGRVQRPYPNKKVPNVVDVVDSWSMFEQLRWKRSKYYKKMGYNIFSLMADDVNSIDFS